VDGEVSINDGDLSQDAHGRQETTRREQKRIDRNGHTRRVKEQLDGISHEKKEEVARKGTRSVGRWVTSCTGKMKRKNLNVPFSMGGKREIRRGICVPGDLRTDGPDRRSRREKKSWRGRNKVEYPKRRKRPEEF